MNCKNFCKNVITIDPSIRYAAIINKSGEFLAADQRKNISKKLSSDEFKMIHYHEGKKWETNSLLSYKIGNTKYSLTEYDEVKRMVFSIDEKKF